MSVIRNVVVPTDYSEASLNALESAGFIAGQNNSRLQVIHVQETDELYREQAELPVSDHVRSVADAIAGGVQQKFGIPATASVHSGFAGPAIVRTALGLKADLLVLGANGASGMREGFIGATAYYVVKYANCPVLIVPEGAKWPGFTNILFPLRTGFGSQKRFEFVRSMGSAQGVNIEIFGLSIDRDPVEGHALELMRNRLNGGTRKNAFTLSLHHSEHKHISREILDRADRIQSDLIVLSPAVDVVNKQFFVGPFSQRILHQAKVPVLYVR